MNYLKFILAAVLSGLLCYFLDTPQKAGGNSVPPIGKLLNPFTGFWQNCESEKAFINREFQFPQLAEPVEVIYDERLVPHIFAGNLRDAAFVNGYVYAQHRLWQMDIATRDIGGRLSEILGPDLLDRDLNQRRMGMLTGARNTLRSWTKSPEHIRILEAYSEGANAWIAQLSPGDYPLEFKLLDYKPEIWTPLKTALFSRQMAKELCSRDDDFASTNTRKILGQELYDFIYPEYNPDQIPVIPSGVPFDFEPVDTKPEKDTSIMMGFIEAKGPGNGPPGIGSNNWAVSGKKTASGNPILCSDPHLALSLPSIWYEIQLHTPDFNTYGVTLPGFAGQVIGFNENIAWGMTNVAQDVQDWYKIQWSDATKSHYIVDGRKVPVKLVVEPIPVKNAPTVYDTVRYTQFGPVVYDDMAVRWIGHDENEPGGEMVTFFKLGRAENFDDYNDALTHYNVPPQNIVFASKEGDIAMQVAGKFPIKPQDNGKFVMDGSTSSSEWKGFIPKAHIPKMKNPENGFVSSANQHSTVPEYPYKYHGRFQHYRGRFLNMKLDTMTQITVEDMKQLQNSNYSQKAADALPLLIGMLDENKLGTDLEKSHYKQLAEWDYRFEKALFAPILFSIWFDTFYDLVWDEIDKSSNGKPMQRPESWRATALLRDDPEHILFDHTSTPEKEVATDIVVRSFEQMVLKVGTLKKEYPDFDWRHYKASRIEHMGRIPAFAINNINIGGDISCPNATRDKHGPSWRMIVEMSDPVSAVGVYPGGQSGNPGSRFYDDMIDEWARGDYFDLHFFRNVEEAREKAFFVHRFN